MSAMGPGCVKTPTYRVFMGTKMSPRATIVDSRAFYKADVSIELSKIEFSHSLGRKQPSALASYQIPRASTITSLPRILFPICHPTSPLSGRTSGRSPLVKVRLEWLVMPLASVHFVFHSHPLSVDASRSSSKLNILPSFFRI